MLDQWQLWFERANFDCDRVPNLDKPLPQVFASCKFCNAPYTYGKEPSSRHTRGRGGGPVQSPTNKVILLF